MAPAPAVAAPGPALAVVAQSRSVEEVMRCMRADPDESIKGCSENLAEASVTGLTRATYYKIRGSSYARKFEYDLAIADFNSAIALAPRDGSIFFVRAAIRRVQGDQAGADADAARAKALGYAPPRPPG
jgi:tetratricopeptide (TPR) repeat protein